MSTPTPTLHTFQHMLAVDIDSHFEDVVLRFQQPLFAHARAMTGRGHDAEEIVQDTFIRAFRALKTYDADRIRTLSLQAWLYRICINVTRNHGRKIGASTVPLDGDEADPAHRGGHSNPPAETFEARESKLHIQKCLATLPSRYRTAVVLRYLNELSYEEISEALGQPIGTVKSNVHRGLAALRNTMTEDLDHEHH